jgi:hypothetical protein
VINSIVSLLRKKFQQNEVVHVAAPTGCAAHQVGGVTIHNLCKLGGSGKYTELKGQRLQDLHETFRHTKALLIDEHSQLSASMIAAIDMTLRKAYNGGLAHDQDFGGLPIIILLGDDYQLPPVKQKGAFDLYKTNITNLGFNDDVRGLMLFRKFSRDVMFLPKSERQKEPDFLNMLECTRYDQLDFIQSMHLSRLHMSEIKAEEDRNKLTRDALFVFAMNKACIDHNVQALSDMCNPTNPVAMIQPKFVYGQMGRKIHFKTKRENFPESTCICRGARVMIKGRNIHPKWGLYNGSISTVIDIVFREGKNPNEGDLPLYVLVEFDCYTGENKFSANRPKVSFYI